jgi:hypothetical protein
VSPFRDLFVELPRALFDALQGIGEQAVRNAQKPTPHHRPSIASTFTDATNGKWLADWLCERFGWTHVEVWRSAADRNVMFMVGMGCGHNTEFSVSEMLLESIPQTGIADLISDCWDHADRGCFCVQR